MLPGTIGHTAVTGYGIMLVLALSACWWLARRRAPAFGIDRSHVDFTVPVIFLVATVGARMLARVTPGDLQIAGGGLVEARYRLFGLAMLALPLLLAYCRIAGISFRQTVDLLAVPVLAWLVVLRVGCLLAGCCWGDIAVPLAGLEPEVAARIQTVPWLTGDWVPALRFPAGSHAWTQQVAYGLIGPAAATSLPVHPAALYELVLASPVAVALARMRPGTAPAGAIALSAAAAYAVLRFVVEFLRADSELVAGGLSVTQYLCLALLVASGAALGLILSRRVPGFAARIRTSS